MKFQVVSTDLNSAEYDAIIAVVWSGDDKSAVPDAALSGELSAMVDDLIQAREVNGKLYEIHVLHTLGKLQARLVITAGLGKIGELNAEKLGHVMGEVVRALRKHRCRTAVLAVAGGLWDMKPQVLGAAVAEGCLLGGYQYRKHKASEDEGNDLEITAVSVADSASHSLIMEGARRGEVIAHATMMARDMVNEPANHMTPTHMAHLAKECADKHSLEITVMDREQMRGEKMGALLGVAQGTSEPPKLIIISYRGDPARPGSTGYVGKGLTFDSGGISLKPQEFMSDMKGDMSGGAAAIAAICAVAELKLKLNLTAVIPATENLPGGRALKPGDVLRASNDKTIEVVNTDAEGRLILADALSYAVKHGISPLVDLATLTGACHVALGDSYAGVFSNDQTLAKRVLDAGREAGEKLWQLPLPDEYKEMNKSDIADIKNSGGRYGGAITAALFLQEFVGSTPWVHMDIAGPFMTDKTHGLLVKGATGFGVRTLVQLAMDLSDGQEG